MYIGSGKNEYGTIISKHRCEYCGIEFTMSPAIKTKHFHNWRGCMSKECESYDPYRDFDLFFDDPEYYKILHSENVQFKRIPNKVKEDKADE